MPSIYQAANLRLGRGVSAPQAVKALQRDLRRLGYLRAGIDGIFGRETEAAVQALQYDLLHNDGAGPDGVSLVRVREYNRGRVAGVDGASSMCWISGFLTPEDAEMARKVGV